MKLSNANCIGAYLHCGRCLGELPEGESPRSWARLEVGWTKAGLQIWCKRHECNVAHIHFEGHTHPANVTARQPSKRDKAQAALRRAIRQQRRAAQ